MSNEPRREREETLAGWDPGTYQDPTKSEERRRKMIVLAVVLLLLCAFACAAVAAYLYI